MKKVLLSIVIASTLSAGYAESADQFFDQIGAGITKAANTVGAGINEGTNKVYSTVVEPVNNAVVDDDQMMASESDQCVGGSAAACGITALQVGAAVLAD